MEPLKKVQVEGFLMFAEPQDLFGNLDELCYVSNIFLVYSLYLLRRLLQRNHVTFHLKWCKANALLLIARRQLLNGMIEIRLQSLMNLPLRYLWQSNRSLYLCLMSMVYM
jgi:hypothetical protein